MPRQTRPTHNALLLASAFTAGLGSIVSQSALIRIFLEVFSGNELVTGVILCNWMFLTAAGAFLGTAWLKRNNSPPAFLIMGLAAFMPLAAGLLIDILRNTLFNQGAMIDFNAIFFSSLLLLSPFCLLNGALFPMLVARIQRDEESPRLARIYSLESIGSIAGGLMFGILLVHFLNNFESLLLVLLLYLFVIASVLFNGHKPKLASATIVVAVGAGIFWFTADPGRVARQAMYQGQEIITEKDTPYGNVVVTKQHEQYSFFMNGELMFSTQNVISNEEAVHFALLQHPEPKRVLIISGDAAGIEKETEKYKNCQVDLIEENAWVIQLQNEITGLKDHENFRIANTDARLFLRQSEKLWDAIIINKGDPSTLASNRFFTFEFFELAKKHLTKNGVIMTSLTSTAEYLGYQSRAMHSSLFVTLSKVFKNVLILPSERDYFLASEMPLHFMVAETADSIGLQNLYVNAGYIDKFSLMQRSEQITKRLDTVSRINEDFFPVSCYFSLQYWLSMAGKGYLIILIVTGVVLLLPLFISKPAGTGIWVAGFTGASMEVMLLMAYQSLYGHMYRTTSIVFAVFMAGLAVAAFLAPLIRNEPKQFYIKNQFVIAVSCLMIPAFLIMLRISGTSGFLLHTVIFLLTFMVALLGGLQFMLAAKLRGGNISIASGILYSLDLIGAAAGALFVSALLMPMIGLVNLGFSIAGVNFITGVYLLIRRKKI